MKLSNPRTSLSINVGVLRVLGLWFPEEKQRSWKSYAYVFYAFLTQGIFYYLFVLSEIMMMIKVFGDIEKMTDASFLLLTHIAQGVKNSFFYKNSKKIVELLNELDLDVYQPKNSIQAGYLRWAMKRARSTTSTFLGSVCVSASSWAIIPLLGKTNDTTPLPVSGWVPFPIDHSPNFEIAFTYLFIGVFLAALTNISMDTMATGLFVHICGQLDILGDALENMKRDALLSLTKKKNSQIKSDKNNNYQNVIYTHDELEREMVIAYKNCVIHHEHIIRYAEDIEELFNMCFLVQFAASLLIICLTFFKIVLVPSIVSIEFASLVGYQICMIVELLLYCWYGNEMILKSTSLGDFVYNSSWYEFSPKFSRDIVLLMARTEKPIRVTSGKFFLLSLNTFISILRLSWSYFAVLNSMHDEA